MNKQGKYFLIRQVDLYHILSPSLGDSGPVMSTSLSDSDLVKNTNTCLSDFLSEDNVFSISFKRFSFPFETL